MTKYLDDRLAVGIILGLTVGIFFPMVTEYKALLVLLTAIVVSVHLVKATK